MDPLRIPGLFPYDARFDQASIDALDTDLAEVIGRKRIITPDQVRGDHATLREAVMAKAWPRVGEVRARDGRRMKAALASGAQVISTDFYDGAPDPEGFGYVADFEGPMFRCNPVTAPCPPGDR